MRKTVPIPNMKRKNIIYIIVILLVIIVLINALVFVMFFNKQNTNQNVKKLDEGSYAPVVNPSDFTTKITNKYFSMPVGKKMAYEANTRDGTERIDIIIPGTTKNIMGVNTLVFWDRVYLNDVLIEDTRDYIAQDKKGNVWYFGEDVDNYKNGVLKDHAGAWIAGVDGAKPGIWMEANPKVGDEYRQEYYKGEAEDIGKVLSLNERVSTPYGTFYNCLKVLEYTPLEPGVSAYKYHCSEVGATALEEEGGERVELVDVQYNVKAEISNNQGADQTVSQGSQTGEPKTGISEEEAKVIALKEVPGKVTDINIEKKSGKDSYVVEVDADNGPETDVIIDIETGEVLGVET